MVGQLFHGDVGDRGAGDVDKLADCCCEGDIAALNLLAQKLGVEGFGDGADLKFGVLVGAETAEAHTAVAEVERGELVVPGVGVGAQGVGNGRVSGGFFSQGDRAGPEEKHHSQRDNRGEATSGHRRRLHQWASHAVMIAISGTTRAGGMAKLPSCLVTQPAAWSALKWW